LVPADGRLEVEVLAQVAELAGPVGVGGKVLLLQSPQPAESGDLGIVVGRSRPG
jgi:hypothetical protein